MRKYYVNGNIPDLSDSVTCTVSCVPTGFIAGKGKGPLNSPVKRRADVVYNG